MKTLIAAAIRCFVIFLVPIIAHGTSAQWDFDPTSGDWNTPVNWTPDAVPNGSNDIATFGISHTTDVSISSNTEVSAIIFTPGASAYTITNPNLTQRVVRSSSAAWVVNNSGTTQTFVAQAGVSLSGGGDILFEHGATAGILTVFISRAGAGGQRGAI